MGDAFTLTLSQRVRGFVTHHFSLSVVILSLSKDGRSRYRWFERTSLNRAEVYFVIVLQAGMYSYNFQRLICTMRGMLRLQQNGRVIQPFPEYSAIKNSDDNF